MNGETLVGWVKRKDGYSIRENKISLFIFSFFSFYISGAISGESSFRSTFNNGSGKDDLLCFTYFCFVFMYFFFVDLRERRYIYIFQFLTNSLYKELGFSFEGKPGN